MRYLILKITEDPASSSPDIGHFDFYLGRMSEVLFATMYLKLPMCFCRKFTK